MTMKRAARVLAALCILLLLAATPLSSGAASYVGNVKSKVFHRLRCHHADCKSCTKYFETRDEALEAGYRPGGCCRP